jgi:hypothetical protein
MDTRKRHVWYYRFRGAVYANGPVRFNDKPRNEREVRAYIREVFGWDRNPRGMEVWCE